MRVLVEILHPAHVHFFRNAIQIWKDRGDEVLVLSREKEVANQLLRGYGIEFESISTLGKGKLAMIREMIVRDVRMLTLTGGTTQTQKNVIAGHIFPGT